MISILEIEGHATDPCSFYRGREPLAQINRLDGYEVVPMGNQIDWSWMSFFDIVFLQRPADDYQLRVIELAKNMNKKIWVDFDDDLINIPDTHPTDLINYYNSKRKILETIIRLSDVVTVSTEDLKEKYSKYNRNIVVIPNCHNDYIFPAKNKSKFTNNNKVFWRGNKTHEHDIYIYKDAINRALKKNREFYFLGERFIFIDKNNNVHYESTMSLIDYFTYIKKLNASLLVVPLDENELNLSKSNISWIEGTYAGSSCLIPDFGDFVNCPGLKYSNEDMFEFLLNKSEKENLEPYNKQSWEYICDNLLLSKQNNKRIEVIKSLA